MGHRTQRGAACIKQNGVVRARCVWLTRALDLLPGHELQDAALREEPLLGRRQARAHGAAAARSPCVAVIVAVLLLLSLALYRELRMRI